MFEFMPVPNEDLMVHLMLQSITLAVSSARSSTLNGFDAQNKNEMLSPNRAKSSL
jgi:hypothetical protein